MVCHVSVHPLLIGEAGVSSQVNERNPKRNWESPRVAKGKAEGKGKQGKNQGSKEQIGDGTVPKAKTVHKTNSSNSIVMGEFWVVEERESQEGKSKKEVVEVGVAEVKAEAVVAREAEAVDAEGEW
jgi:hypothetical protein